LPEWPPEWFIGKFTAALSDNHMPVFGAIWRMHLYRTLFTVSHSSMIHRFFYRPGL